MTFSVPSANIVPSGDKAKASVSSVCSPSERRSAPSETRQNFTKPSRMDPEIRVVPSGEKKYFAYIIAGIDIQDFLHGLNVVERNPQGEPNRQQPPVGRPIQPGRQAFADPGKLGPLGAHCPAR